MFRRGLTWAAALPLVVLLFSVGVDLHVVFSGRPAVIQTTAGKIAFPEPGPRRYPPGYQPVHHSVTA